MNVVFIVLDTVRKDRLSPYNENIDFTQTLQEFSEEATVFEDAVSQAAWTLPSHASMFTGLYLWEHNATHKQLYLDTDQTMLAEKFEHAGYSTACYTSNTWISPHIGMADGFQDIDNFFGIVPSDFMSGTTEKLWRYLNNGRGEWLIEKLVKIGEFFHERNPDDNTKTPKVIQKAKKFVENNQENDFFLFVNFMDAHLPYYPPEEYREKHAPGVDPDEICQAAHLHNSGIEEADFEASKKLYNAEIDYLDDQLSGLFEFFSENGLDEDTVFVVVADHGENLGEDGMFGHQFSVSEQLVSVPLMIKSPDLDEERVEEQVELRELYELVPRLAGIEDGETSYGSEFALGGYAYPKNELKNIPKELHDRFGKELSFVRTKDKKLVRTGDEDEMIDLETGESIEIEQEFLDRLNSIGTAEDGDTEIDEERVKQRLEDLGYM